MSAQSGGLRMRNVLRAPAGARLLVLIAVATAAAIALYASTAPAGKAASTDVQEHPVIDNDFLYSELYFSSTHFIFRVGGADGPPSSPADANNLPANYNGANEFYAWWKTELTNPADDHMGPMGNFVTAKDHLEPCCSGSGNQTFPWQLDDATVTVPGASCPGQVVLITGHNDSTPTSTGVANGSASGSATPMSSMRSGNWGNGSPYDADSGITMGMAEFQGLLRWYQANGTYPKRTIKAGLFDAEETGLVGSGEYSQTDTPTAFLAPSTAGATTIYVASLNGIPAGSTIVVDQFGHHESTTVAAVGVAARNATTLAAAVNAGATNIKVTSVTNMRAGETISIDTGANQEVDAIATVGTAGAGGTGVTLTTPLTINHAAGVPAQDIGTGLTLAAPLGFAYPTGTQLTRTALGLIPDGPQGQYVMVANMDQNGLEYPAYHWGTQHYLNNIVGGNVGPWYTNINAVPLSPNGQYPATSAGWARIQANMAAEIAFRNATADAVSTAFSVLGQKYAFSVPLENPLMLSNVGSTPDDPNPQSVPAYTPDQLALFSPVVDDNLGRTDQVSFINRGIPGYGIVGAYDSSTNQTIGGNENPYPSTYASKPTLGQYAGYDTNDDTIQHLNYWASGTTHGPGGVDQPAEELKRALELPATWTDYLIQKDDYAGAEPKGTGPVAYFETGPTKPTTTNTVTFDASFSRTADGTATGLKYFWDFGDGTTQATTAPTVSHTYTSTSPSWYDVKLAVYDGTSWDFYRQAVAVEFQPTLFPSTPPAGEPVAPSTDACGSLTADEQAAMTTAAQQAFASLPSP
jgi:hypothetical protein